jgi:hypothetical protein
MKNALIINPRAGKKELATIGDNECFGFCNLLKLCNIEPKYLKPNKFDNNTTISIDELTDINDFDYIFVYCFNPNFFGGVEDKFLLNCYKLLAKCNKPIYYLLVDMGNFFKQLGEKVMERDWETIKSSQYSDFVVGDIHYISQGYDIDLINKLKAYKGVISTKTSYFPLQFCALFNEGRIKPFGEYNPNREYDLYYGGSYRSGKRHKQFKEYMFNRNIKTGFFGTISLKDFKNDYGEIVPEFNGKVKQNEIIDENKRGLATIILNEKYYNNNVITLRVFESLLADMVVFIDKPFDVNKVVFEDEVLRNFNYVSNGVELEKKIKMLKEDKTLLFDIINRQRKEFNRWFNIDSFKSMLLNILNEV